MSRMISLASPLSRATLTIIKRRLALVAADENLSSQGLASAAVLIPLCNVDNIPGILLQVRSIGLRSHGGEVSFPGGRVDPSDESFLAASLRETHEEMGILPSQIQYLGSLGPPEISLSGTLRVWPYVGFVHPSMDSRLSNENDTTPLPSISLSILREKLSREEVAHIFHLPFDQLVSERMRSSWFRGREKYFTLDVSDMSGEKIAVSIPTVQVDEVGSGKDGKVEVWGLTGWYLNLFLRALQIPGW